MIISKKTIIIAMASIWILFSFAYVSRDLWNHFKTEQIALSYQQGKTDTINAAIAQAKNEKCEAFSIYNDKEQIQLINVGCLTQPAAGAAGEK